MIIKREYVNLEYLYNADEDVAKLIDETFIKSKMDAERAKEIWEGIIVYNLSLAECHLGCGLPDYGYLKTNFKKLDRLKPFDNHFSLDDVGCVDIIYNDEKELVIALKDGIIKDNIVQVIKIKNNANKLSISLPSNIHFGFD